jgi:hypothetical protein
MSRRFGLVGFMKNDVTLTGAPDGILAKNSAGFREQGLSYIG